jgi:hypothetical protein
MGRVGKRGKKRRQEETRGDMGGQEIGPTHLMFKIHSLSLSLFTA